MANFSPPFESGASFFFKLSILRLVKNSYPLFNKSICVVGSLVCLLGPLASAESALTMDPVEGLTSASGSPSFVERRRSLHSLDAATLRRNSDRLLAFLNVAKVPSGMELDDFLSLKNDVADLFIAHDIAPSAHLRLSLTTIADSAADFVWRDYCLQKLPELLASEQLDPADRATAADILQSLTRADVPGLTGTACIAALRLADTPAADLAPGAETLGRRALRCASDTEALLIDRVTTLQIAAELGHFGTAAYAATLLEAPSSDVPPMLRVSALAALGVLADPAYLPLLERHRLSPDVRLRAAARTALGHIAAN